MDACIFEVPFEPDCTPLLSRLGLDPDSDEAADFLRLLERIAPLAKPKAALMEADVEKTASPDRIVIGSVEFKSLLLAENLRDEAVVWPYLATCGREIYDFVFAMTDPFERYWGEEIMQEALSAAIRALERHVRECVFPGKTAVMSPGSLEEWPIQQQRPLFRLLGDVVRRCDVTLTETLLMLPNKSVSGIRFHNEHEFVSCRLCPRVNCPNRKVEYDSRAQSFPDH